MTKGAGIANINDQRVTGINNENNIRYLNFLSPEHAVDTVVAWTWVPVVAVVVAAVAAAAAACVAWSLVAVAPYGWRPYAGASGPSADLPSPAKKIHSCTQG